MVFAITGGIGSGKSLVMRMLEADGYLTLSADKIYNDNIQKGFPLYDPIKKNFESVICDSGEIDKKKLADIVFHDATKLKILNGITHPFIIKKIKEYTNDSNIYIVEVPLLFESKLQSYFNCVILIVAEEEIRINRVMLRNGLSREDVVKRIDSQISDVEKANLSNYVVENNGDIQTAYYAVKEIIDGRKNI